MFCRPFIYLALLVMGAMATDDVVTLTGVPLATLRNTPGYDIGATGSNLLVVDVIRPHTGPCSPFRPAGYSENGTSPDDSKFSNKSTCYILDSVGLALDPDENNLTLSLTSVVVQPDIDVELDCASKAGNMENYTWSVCGSDECTPQNFTKLDLSTNPTATFSRRDLTLDTDNGNLIILGLKMRNSGLTYACSDGSNMYTWRFYIYEPGHYYKEIIILCCVSFVLFVGAAVLLLRDYIVYEKRYSGKEEAELVPLTGGPSESRAYGETTARKRGSVSAKDEVELASITQPQYMHVSTS